MNYVVQIEVIKAMALLKKACAEVNKTYGLDSNIAENVKKAADEVVKIYVLIETLLNLCRTNRYG